MKHSIYCKEVSTLYLSQFQSNIQYSLFKYHSIWLRLKAT